MPLVGGFGCLELSLYCIRELAWQHLGPQIPYLEWTSLVMIGKRKAELSFNQGSGQVRTGRNKETIFPNLTCLHSGAARHILVQCKLLIRESHQNKNIAGDGAGGIALYRT